MEPQILHNWLGLLTLALHAAVTARLLYMEQEHQWFRSGDIALIILAETSLSIQIIDGIYLAWALERETRLMHHFGALTPVVIAVLLGLGINHSAFLKKGKEVVGSTLVVFTVNTILIFLAYWVSTGAALGWWLFPEQWSNELVR